MRWITSILYYMMTKQVYNLYYVLYKGHFLPRVRDSSEYRPEPNALCSISG